MDRNQLVTMLTMQDSFNKKVNPDWVNAKYLWTDAIMIEGVEAMEHYGQWKWWKKQNPDISQTVMELVDIWHFIMSDMMELAYLANREGNYIEKAADIILADYAQHKNDSVETDTKSVNMYFRQMIGRAANQESTLPQFYKLLTVFGMNFDTSDKLFKLYVGKNVLNGFRQDNGYKTGEYIKIWNGKEDNEVLSELLSNVKADNDDFSNTIYNLLKSEYAKVK